MNIFIQLYTDTGNQFCFVCLYLPIFHFHILLFNILSSVPSPFQLNILNFYFLSVPSVLFTACLKARDIETATSLLDLMRSPNTLPDFSPCNPPSFSRDRHTSCVVSRRQGLQPTIATYQTILATACAVEGSVDMVDCDDMCCDEFLAFHRD